MPVEIERKYLLTDDSWREEAGEGVMFRQGYLTSLHGGSVNASVRVRIEGKEANVNFKSVTVGASRLEYEYPIPLEDAEEMLDLLSSGPLIEKVRYFIHRDGVTWEIDEFSGDNKGLVVAEVELDHSSQTPVLPKWVGMEVTEETRYYNACLVNNPFSGW